MGSDSRRLGPQAFRPFLKCLLSCSLLCLLSPVWAGDLARYPETIAALKELHNGEVKACRTYSAYAETAREEGNDSVEKLFYALRASEVVHARNFGNLLSELGVQIEEDASLDIKAFETTKENLNHALSTELSEIDTSYPSFITRVRMEGHESALEEITYAWMAERQHRDLIRTMRSAIRFFFWKIVSKLKQAEGYFVCQRCGSTLVELPKDFCPICGSAPSLYRKVEAPPFSDQ